MNQSRELRLDIPSQFEELDLVDSLMDALFLQIGFDEDECSNMTLAVREAAANAVQHGNQLDPNKRARIEIRIGSDEVCARIGDEGSGFDVDALPDPLAPENLLKPTGRGILLMRNFMDEVTFEFPTGGGTLVSMRKSIPARDRKS